MIIKGRIFPPFFSGSQLDSMKKFRNFSCAFNLMRQRQIFFTLSLIFA